MKSKYDEFKYWFEILPGGKLRILDKVNNKSTFVKDKSNINAPYYKDIVEDFYNFSHNRPEGKLLELPDIKEPIQLPQYLQLLKGSYLARSFSNSSDNWNEDGAVAEFDRFAEWLIQTNIADTPFSNNYFNYKHGLITYLYTTAQNMIKLSCCEFFSTISMGSALFCALTHRLDKLNRYTYSLNSNGTISSLKVSSKPMLSFGKSISTIILLSRYFNLKVDEELAIRWCNGAWYTDISDYGDLSVANQNALVKLLQFAVNVVF